MTKDRVWRYVRELAYLLKQAMDADSAIDAMTSEIEIAKATNQAQHGAEVIAQRAKVREQHESIVALALTKANRKDFAGAVRLSEQLQVRLSELETYEREVTLMDAQFEMANAMGEFADEDGPAKRASVETMLTKARDRAAMQLKLASDLVPDKPVVLTL